MRKENIRNVFNSPMHSFVLATTSIRQLGDEIWIQSGNMQRTLSQKEKLRHI